MRSSYYVVLDFTACHYNCFGRIAGVEGQTIAFVLTVTVTHLRGRFISRPTILKFIFYGVEIFVHFDLLFAMVPAAAFKVFDDFRSRLVADR